MGLSAMGNYQLVNLLEGTIHSNLRKPANRHVQLQNHYGHAPCLPAQKASPKTAEDK